MNNEMSDLDPAAVALLIQLCESLLQRGARPDLLAAALLSMAFSTAKNELGLGQEGAAAWILRSANQLYESPSAAPRADA